MNTRVVGNLGENKAVGFLRKNNYLIVERNFRCRTGEIDIIAYHEGYVVFIEVKSRNNSKFGLPREAVTYQKQRTIISCANYWLSQNKITGKPARFDVVEVTGEQIYVIQDAFRA